MSNRPSIRIDYPYVPLQSKANVRLLTLLPGLKSDNIHCTLRETSLEPHLLVDYEALSYSWGNSADVHHTIWIDEHPVRVRENLFYALVGLRKSHRSRDLWVDAISINQSDLSERTSQISQMGRIFGQADQVIVWAGLSTDSSRNAMKFVKDLYAALVCDGTAPNSETQKYTISKFLNKKRNQSLWAAFANFCDRPYWKRRWIVQEIALASRCVIQCGNDTLEWEAFEIVCLEITRPNDIWCPEILPFRYSLAIMCAMLRSTRQKTFDLQYLLEMFEASVCKESHDKIFAMLALVDVNLVPDYNKHLFELWADVIRCLLPIYISKTPNGERRLDCPKSTVRVSQGVQRNLGDVSAGVERDVIQAISASIKIPGTVKGGKILIQGVIGGPITHLCPYSEDITAQSVADQFRSQPTYYDRVDPEVTRTSVLKKGLEFFDNADKKRVISFSSRSSYGQLGWFPAPYSLRRKSSPRPKRDAWILLFCLFLETVLFSDYMYSLLGIVPVLEFCLVHHYELICFSSILISTLEKERHRQNKLDLEIKSATNPQIFLATNDMLGVVPENVLPGDTIVQFLNCDVAAVIRPYGNRYKFVGRALVFRGSTSMRLHERTAKSFKYAVPMGEDAFHKSRRVCFYVDFAVLQILTR